MASHAASGHWMQLCHHVTFVMGERPKVHSLEMIRRI